MASFAVLVGEPTEINRREIAGGKSVTSFRVDGINAVAWEALGEGINEGSRYIFTGRIQARTYQKKEGGTAYITEVVVNAAQPIDAAREEELDI